MSHGEIYRWQWERRQQKFIINVAAYGCTTPDTATYSFIELAHERNTRRTLPR